MSNRYRDASLSPEERTEDLLAQMTLDEKLAQLQCHFFAHGDLQKDTRYGIGQVSTLEFRQALSLEEAAGIQREIQETVMKNSRRVNAFTVQNFRVHPRKKVREHRGTALIAPIIAVGTARNVEKEPAG